MKNRMMFTSLVAISAGMMLVGEVSAQQLAKRGMAKSLQIQELAAFESYSLTLPSEPGQSFTAYVQLGQSMKSLDLHPYSMRAEDFQVLVMGENGTLVPAEIPPVTTYRGNVRGDDGSKIAASLIDGQLWGTIVLGSGELWAVQPAKAMGVAGAAADLHIVYRGEDAIKPEGVCGVTEEPKFTIDEEDIAFPTAGSDIFMTDIALDADFEFYQLNGSSVTNTVADMFLIMNILEVVYENNAGGSSPLDITYEITTVIVRNNVADPYSSSNPVTLLNQMQSAWNSAPESAIRRDLAHLFTGRDIQGGIIGIAFLGQVCNLGQAYCLSQSRFTVNVIFRAALTAHEIGHNWNSGHCDGAGNCHIMCSGLGGCQGIGNFFGPTATSSIIAFRNSRACLFDLPSPLNPPFNETFATSSVNIHRWIYNFGGVISGASSNPPSGSLALNLDGGSGLYEKDEIRSNFINLQGQSGIVLSYYTESIGVEAGESLIVEYWRTVFNGQWVLLNEIVSNGVNQTEYDFHTHDLPIDAYHSEFRIRFRTQVNNSSDDWYIDDVSIAAVAPCTADISGDGTVNTTDLLILFGNWGPNPDSPSDLDGNGTVNTTDLLILFGNWGPCP